VAVTKAEHLARPAGRDYRRLTRQKEKPRPLHERDQSFPRLPPVSLLKGGKPVGN